MRQKDFSGALKEYDRFLKSHPGSITTRVNRATCLFNLNRFAETLVGLEAIPSTDSAFASEVLRRRGDVLQILGRLDEACDAYDQGIQLSPGNVALLFSRAQLRKVRSDESFFQFIRNFEAAVVPLNGRVKATAYYAIGKAYADVGNLEKAVSYYNHGAKALCSAEPYNEAADIALDDLILSLCKPELLSRSRPYASDTRRPFFILGMPRSGTTLVEQILATHPTVYPGGELIYMGQALRALSMPDAATGDIQPTTESVSGCANRYLAMLSQLPGADRSAHVTDKLPLNYRFIGLIAAGMPGAKIIHCRRSPIDTALSCYTTLFSEGQIWTYDFRTLAKTYRRYRKMMQYWRQLLPGRIHEIRYESLIVEPEKECRALLEACEITWDARVLEFYATQRPVATASVSQVRRPLYTSSSGRWKNWAPYIQPLIEELFDLEEAYWKEIGVEINR